MAHVDFLSFEDRLERARLSAQLDIEPQTLSDGEIDQLLSFLGALTGEASTKVGWGVPRLFPAACPSTEPRYRGAPARGTSPSLSPG